MLFGGLGDCGVGAEGFEVGEGIGEGVPEGETLFVGEVGEPEGGFGVERGVVGPEDVLDVGCDLGGASFRRVCIRTLWRCDWCYRLSSMRKSCYFDSE
jgi:hypothetical protein